MSITKDVILDLLPLYEAGEASADTRRVVEDFLRDHPDIASTSMRSADTMLKKMPSSSLERDRRKTLERTRGLLLRRQAFFGLALGCTLMAFTFAFEGTRVTWFMWRDAPSQAAMLMGVGIACWIGYFWTRKQLQVAGM
jgi:hypothetical protein